MSDCGMIPFIGSPKRIRDLSMRQLEELAAEIRNELISTVAKTGGHLASNLGIVELTLALLCCFDVPEDKIVWDVGHQCYTYKILTGRYAQFCSLRQEGGLSGFPKTAESPCDSFISGHASTSIAVAFGLKRAMMLQNNSHHVVAVIGDGAMTGGLAYEGLNNVGKSREGMIIILNDNEMAISKNEGALARYLAVMRSKPGYFKAKRVTEQVLKSVPLVGKQLCSLAGKSKSMIKQVLYPSTFFEEFGFDYLGPIDGHNIQSLCDVLTQAKALNVPCIVHVETVKGKGYSYAEQNPSAFHGISRFDVRTGKPIDASTGSFSEVFGREMVKLGKENSRVCAITAAMEQGTGLQYFAREFKSSGRYYDVGIAEEFGVTFSAALSSGGMLPVFAVYSTFLQRGYDQLLHDAAIEGRHIVLGIDRAGLVGDDGETHQGIFDVPFLATVPGATVFAPANYCELRAMLRLAIMGSFHGPVAVRYPRGGENPILSQYCQTGAAFDLLNPDSECLLITYGRTFGAAMEAAQHSKIPLSILKLNRILPLEEKAVLTALPYQRVIFVEEGYRNGGIGMQFLAQLMLAGYHGKAVLRAIEGFVPQSKVADALHRLGLDADGMLNLMEETS